MSDPQSSSQHDSSGSVFASAAMQLASQGWPVFPLVPRTKIPYAGSHGHLDATTDPVVVSRWAAVKPAANIGLRVPEDVIVLDEDRRGALQATGLELPPTREVATRRGRHLYYRLPDLGQRRLRRRLDGVDADIKGHNGFVAAPGSVHASGKFYRLVREVPLNELPTLPDEWLALISRNPVQEELSGGAASTAGANPTRHHPRRLGQLMRVKVEGTRRDFLLWALCQAHRNYSGDDLMVAVAELEIGALAAGLEQPDIDGLIAWAANQFTSKGKD